jgi:hypothetical protein
MKACVIGLLLLSACAGARLGGNAADDDDQPGDANTNNPDGPAVDPDSAPVCEKRQVFLSFEGETLTDGAASDAKQNIASWMQGGVTTATIPRYRTGAADRATQINTIVTAAKNRLAAFGIDVVTTRPVTGDYMMIVFGGTAANAGSRFGFVQELDCGDNVRNDVAWVADNFDPASIPNAIVGSIGFAIGLTATLDGTDCMCAWDNDCTPTTNNCVLHDGIARDPAANQLCAGAGATQDEIVELNRAFCN